MIKANIAMVIIGLIVILFVIFCPLAESKNMAWRISIGLVGYFSLVSGVYKIVSVNGCGHSAKNAKQNQA